MPKGIPKLGFRAPRGSKKNATAATASMFRQRFQLVQNEKAHKTDEQIAARINERFDVLHDITLAATRGDARAVIVSGPGGLGKSFTVEDVLRTWGEEDKDFRIIKGYVKATGLYKALYEYREAGKVLVFDDADSVFGDDIALSFLKAACDSTDVRKICYLGETNMTTEDGIEKLPRSFIFEGTIVFISNLDWNAIIEKGGRLAPHMQAFKTRAYMIDLAIHTVREYMIRIKDVVAKGLLDNRGLDAQGKADVMKFMEDNINKLDDVSLRTVIKLANLRKGSPNWERTARVSLLRAH